MSLPAFKSPLALGLRRLPRASALLIAVCLCVLLILSYPTAHSGFRVVQPHHNDGVQGAELDGSHDNVEPYRQQASGTPSPPVQDHVAEGISQPDPPHDELKPPPPPPHSELPFHDGPQQPNSPPPSAHDESPTLGDPQQPKSEQAAAGDGTSTGQEPPRPLDADQPSSPPPLHHEEQPPLDEPGTPTGDLNASPKGPDRDRRFVLVIPATSPSPDLCKTIVTALALGYPSPVIVNWGLDFHTVTKWEGGQNLPKLPGFVKYLDAVMHPDAHPDERLGDEDIVLMVDAYDVWFQLPAEVLLRRYHAINERADARLNQQWGREEPNPMKQTVIAASGKHCHPQPDSGSDTHCERMPQSPLRSDLYGPGTEKNATKFRDHRPRFINGGLYMGPARDIRRLFRRALQKMEAGIGQGVRLFSEQGIPGEVLGEQEVWRQWRRSRGGAIEDDDAQTLMDRDFEYHFGLDYKQELSVQTFWTDTADGSFDGAFVSLNNQTAVRQYSEALGIRPVRLRGVPADVGSAHNPLNGLVESPDWGEMSLYADFFTESVPVIVHHNGFKERRTSWWDRPWLHRFLRPLLARQLAVDGAPRGPVAVVDVRGETTRYLAPMAENADRRPRLMADSAEAPLAKMALQDVCRYPDEMSREPGHHWWDEVFGDAEGPFE
ncbi:hypothetical protein AAL_08414 [Moelleriella libera RCEF 2490]|uniref:Uncharacterized protein n=1 Tax=Moelleriella libera RCEF 2490 TaxID=1081109 RepID=A0A167VBP8_9HYPO|nr:hypothetical protein AAL_08414 [Moelleriella libera RCEF 2490]